MKTIEIKKTKWSNDLNSKTEITFCHLNFLIHFIVYNLVVNVNTYATIKHKDTVKEPTKKTTN